MDGKRVFDIVFSIVALCVCAPIIALIMLGIKLSSSGTVMYTQKRLGQQGKVFKCLKFRTMSMHAEEELERILERDTTLRVQWQHNQKLKHDPRVFSFGKFLRKTSLDELPQFWN